MKKYIILLLLLINCYSCVSPISKIELVQSNAYFENKKDYEPRGGDFKKMIKSTLENGDYKKPIIPNAYFINYEFVIKNNTGENIEKVEIKTRLKLYYKHKTEVVDFNPLNQYITIHYESSPIWKKGNTLPYSEYNLIRNEKLFKHTPNKIEFEIDVRVKNSVGYTHTQHLLLVDELKDSWNNLN